MHSKLSVVLVSIGLIGLSLISVAARGSDAPAIENETLRVTFDSSRSCFAVRDRASGRVFVTRGRLAGSGGTAKVSTVADARFGGGQAIEIAYSNGNRDTMLLFRGVPFVLFRALLHNGGAGGDGDQPCARGGGRTGPGQAAE